MQYLLLFLLVVFVLGMAAVLLGDYIGNNLVERLFPESLNIPPTNQMIGGQVA